jgi:uncharacterized phage protein (TIGR02216 family)
MSFADTALHLAGQAAMLLGWRPDEFWQATPAELATTLAAFAPADAAADHSLLEQMMEQYPDAPTGGD